MTLDPAVAWALRLALAWLWLRAAAHKAADPAAFRAALAGYGLLPEAAVPLAACGLIAVELGLAAGLLAAPAVAIAAIGSAALLGLYSAAIAFNLARGRRDVDCGCAGPRASRPLGEGLLVRNGLLAALALAASLPAAARSPGWLDAATALAAAAAFALLYTASEQALALAPRLALLRSRP